MNMPHHPAMLRLTFIGTDDGVEAHNSSACCCRSPPNTIRLGLPLALCRCFAAPNILDSSQAGVRQHTRRLTRWRNEEVVELTILERTDWCNNRRLLNAIGDVPPVKYECQHYHTQIAPAMVAGVN